MKLHVHVIQPERTALGAHAGRRMLARAKYVRTGTRVAFGRSFLTVLLEDVREAATGDLLADHLWFNRGAVWRSVGLMAGDIVELEARPIEYRTGYWGPNRVLRMQRPPRVEFKMTAPSGLRVEAGTSRKER